MLRKISSVFLCTALGFAAMGAVPASTAYAADAINFAPGNPWSQAIGNVSKTSDFHEYTVVASAGKTLQINLISRNPNLFFRVLSAESSKPLVDTASNGATTWTTKPQANATYTVRV